MAAWWLLFPARCAVCGVVGGVLCERCDRTLVRLAPPLCERCRAPGAWPVRRCSECAGRRLAFASARASVAYEGNGRRVVHAWKEGGRRDLAAVAAGVVASVLPRPAATALTFVPGDPERRRGRGHVPSRRLAEELGRLWGLPVHHLMRRTRPVRPQRGLSLAERRGNVRGAFACDGAAGAVVCLVDDVYTTGATANACASALRRGGARRVDVVCFARALR
jgi:predicted amidophosphoribosyltransferase